ASSDANPKTVGRMIMAPSLSGYWTERIFGRTGVQTNFTYNQSMVMACQATIDHLLLSHCLETRSTGSVTARKKGINHGVTRMATDKR
ncbi:MAG: hypothetical protein V3R70_06985, partial [Syntrophobacteria bacterium]